MQETAKGLRLAKQGVACRRPRSSAGSVGGLGTATTVRSVRARLVADAEHYSNLVLRILNAATSVWISTANLKDIRIEAPVGTRARARGRYVSLVQQLSELAGRGIEVRLLHAAPPSRAFRASLEALAAPGVELRQCPRVHLKLVCIDGALLYLGSANFTGAGLGAKGAGRRNFELGVITDDDVFLDAAQAQFEAIWSGNACAACKLRRECPAPLDERLSKRRASVRIAKTRASRVS